MKKQVLVLVTALLSLSLSAAPKKQIEKKESVTPYRMTVFNETGKNITVDFMYAQDQKQAEKSMKFLAASSRKYRTEVINFRIKKVVVKEGFGRKAKVVAQKNVNIYKDTSLNVIFKRGKYTIEANLQADWFIFE